MSAPTRFQDIESLLRLACFSRDVLQLQTAGIANELHRYAREHRVHVAPSFCDALAGAVTAKGTP